MVEVKSPGQAAREADASSVYGPDDDKYWDAIAAAAIEAAKQSGEYAALRAIADACEKQDADGWELGMLVDEAFEKYRTIQKPGYTGTAHTTQLQPQPTQPALTLESIIKTCEQAYREGQPLLSDEVFDALVDTYSRGDFSLECRARAFEEGYQQAKSENKTPPTENKDEREHCYRVTHDEFGGFGPNEEDRIRDFVTRERAAADKAGYERACQEANTLRNQHLEAQLRQNDRLQSRFERLSTAAEEVRRFIPVCTDLEGTYPGLHDRLGYLFAALAETEEKTCSCAGVSLARGACAKCGRTEEKS